MYLHYFGKDIVAVVVVVAAVVVVVARLAWFDQVRLLTIQEHCDAVAATAVVVVVAVVAYEDMVVAVNDVAASASAFVLLVVLILDIQAGYCSSCQGVVAVTYDNPSWGVRCLVLPWVAYQDAVASCWLVAFSYLLHTYLDAFASVAAAAGPSSFLQKITLNVALVQGISSQTG